MAEISPWNGLCLNGIVLRESSEVECILKHTHGKIAIMIPLNTVIISEEIRPVFEI